MNCCFFVVGNYGSGKSSMLEKPITEKIHMLCCVGDNNWILGTETYGADSLSKYTKQQVFDELSKHSDKHIFIAGVYYSSILDVVRMSKTHKAIVIYLETSFENNAKRILKRKKLINIKTYHAKMKSHISMLKKIKGYAVRHIINNNRPKEIVFKEFWEFVENQKRVVNG